MRAQHIRKSQRRPQLVPVDLNAFCAAKQQVNAQQDLIYERLEINAMITERVVGNGMHPTVVSIAFDHIFFTAEQARAILPTLLQVNDEIDRLRRPIKSSHQARELIADIKAGIGLKKWYPRQGSNLRPFAPEANALIH